MTDLGWIFSALGAIACIAWIAAEARVTVLEAQKHAAELSYQSLMREHEHQTRELRVKRQLLTEALAAMPDTPRGRELGDAIRFQAWPNRKVGRLERHLSLVDREPVA